MKDFENTVKKHYPNSNETISNGSLEHAKILAKYLFRYAKEKGQDIRIITGVLDKDFYELFSVTIKEILINNKVSIISEKQYQKSNFADEINSSKNGNIRVIAKSDKIKSLPHFILVGECAYRLETNDNLKLATASFNRPGVGNFLLDIFNRVK